MAGKGVDRLSSLPDDIIIRILSFLPLQLAIVTGCLSSQWRGLWKNVTSINIINRELKTISEFFTAFSNTMSQIRSPFICSLAIELRLRGYGRYQQTYDFSWLREVCDRSVCRLKLTWTYGNPYTIMLPSFVFQTSSLVSLELMELKIGWELPYSVNLPNLKYLCLKFRDGQCESVAKLIKTCPSLEELSLTCVYDSTMPEILMLSNPNLVRLALNLYFMTKGNVVINAPKLEYLAFSTPSSVKLNFEEEPVGLREAKIRVIGCLIDCTVKFTGSIANVRHLTLDHLCTLMITSSVFHRATQVTLCIYASHSIEDLLAFMKLCPVLGDLCLKYFNVVDFDVKLSVLGKVNLLRGLKRITIETTVSKCFKPSKSCLKLVEYLLCNAVNLKHFRFRIDVPHLGQTWDARCRQRNNELSFCKLLHDCPTVPVGCEVEFKGVFFNMSRKLGPKAWSTDGEVIAFDNLPWNGFVIEEY